MPEPLAHALDTSVVKPSAGAVVLRVEGEIDMLTAPPFESALTDMLTDPSATVLVVDLTDVTFLASVGLAVLIRGADQAAQRGMRLRLVAPSRAVRRPLEITGFDQLFAVYDDRAGALAPSD